MKKLYFILIALMSSVACFAQYAVSDNYRQWFSDDHAIYTRMPVECTPEGPELWNGCHVRRVGQQIRIYDENNSYLFWGEEVTLLHTGYYRVKKNGRYYIYNPEGERTDIYGQEIMEYPWMAYAVKKDNGYWYVYRVDGTRLSFHSEIPPYTYWNGCWSYVLSGREYATDINGNRISGVYGDDIRLLDSGKWKCIRGNNYRIVD